MKLKITRGNVANQNAGSVIKCRAKGYQDTGEYFLWITEITAMFIM